MQDVENNMDELFRKAAVEYPLKDGKDDWDRIAPLLLNNPAVAGAPQKKNAIKKYSSLLLLLVFFLFIAGIVINNIREKTKTRELSHQSQKENLPVVIKETAKMSQQPGAVKYKPLIHANNIQLQYQQLVRKNIQDQAKSKFIKEAYSSFGNKRLEDKRIFNEPGINNEIAQKVKINQNNIIENIAVKQIDSVSNYTEQAFFNKVIRMPQIINEGGHIDIAKKAAVIQKGSAKKQHGIYWGIAFGPSFNQVKSQGLKKTGYDIGILSGYKMNNKLSIEAALLFEKKYYFSSGKYFDMKKASATMPTGMKVLSLEGSCTVFEIPFKVKYNLPAPNSQHFFATAGISTYIITGENNKYLAVVNGTQQSISGNYNSTSRYLAAAFNVSLGYEGKIGTSTHIRIEPYFQIPLRGIGVGSLPVMTTGLHIGFTRPAH
jgi:hypothetical protein